MLFPQAARTFGHHLLKRLTFAIIPTAFVVGIIITLLAALTVVSVKSLGVGVSYKHFTQAQKINFLTFPIKIIVIKISFNIISDKHS